MLGLWCSDIHLNHASNGTKRKFLNKISKSGESLFITGDISDGLGFINHMSQIAEACKGTVYFVTGNHDYYHRSWKEIDNHIKALTTEFPNLVYLPHNGIVNLGNKTCVIGPESWCDGKIAWNLSMLKFTMNDFFYIKDLRDSRDKMEMISIFQDRASNGLKELKRLVNDAVKTYDKIIIMSHVVPFGSMDLTPSDQSPFYVWYEGGMFMGDFASLHQDKEFLWLCGHTHTLCDKNYGNSLRCISLCSKYTIPKIGASIDEKLNVTLLK